MSVILFIILPLLYAFLAVPRIVPNISRVTRAGLSILLSFLATSWLSLLLSPLINPTLSSQLLLLLSFILVVFQFWIRKEHFAAKATTFVRKSASVLVEQRRLFVLLTGFSLLFLSLLYTHSARQLNGNWYSGGSTWGDLPLHLTYIHYFARQETLSLAAPIYAQNQSTYPFLFDWYTSLLVRLGASVQTGLIVSQFLGFLAILLLAVGLIRKLDRRPNVIVFTFLVFFLGGGFGWWFFWGDWQNSGLSLLRFLQEQPWQFTNMPDRHIFFSTIIPDMLLPQRGFVIGLAVTLGVSQLLISYSRTGQRFELLLSSVLLGLLPFFHIHSFLWLLGLWSLLALYGVWTQPKTWRWYALSAGCIAVLALPQLWWFFSQGVGGHFIKWQPGWMISPSITPTFASFIKLFALNFGITTALLLLLPPRLKSLATSNPVLALLFGYSWLVFMVCLLVSFQPWAYDNLKFMMVSYFFLCLFLAMHVANLRGKLRLLSAVVIILGTLSGGLSVIREIFLHSEMISAKDLVLADELRKTLEPGAIVLTGSQHNHLIPMAVGQPIVMGYGGWLWSHGINASTTSSDVALMYGGDERTESLLDAYDVRYVYISDRERDSIQINELYWQQKYEAIYQSNDVAVFDVALKKY